MLLDKNAIVAKLQPGASNADQESYVTYSGAFPLGVAINIQPASAELTAISEGETFKTFRAFVTSSGVVETMRLTVSGTTDRYIVRGREAYDYGSGQHYELVLQKKGDL